jgi:hypothetical protein
MHEPDIQYLDFTPPQAQAVATASRALALLGGPQAPGVARQAREHAEQLRATFSDCQRDILQRFAQGQLSALLYRHLPAPNDPLPECLPSLAALEQAPACLYLAARNQLLLALAFHRAFAFDIDNHGQQVRLVGNFKGGGYLPRPGEDRRAPVEFSSHSGLPLGAHTEAPYHCSVHPHDGHSPAPSALILSARWNPAHEPTRITPLAPIIQRLGSLHALALTSPAFDYTRSDCFVPGLGVAGRGVSMLQFEANGGFAMRYNAYRFSLNDHASAVAAQAFDALTTLLRQAQPVVFDLQPDNTLLINNSRALHGRDAVKDNRRLLVRLFGYAPYAHPVVLNDDPLLVRG